jgi:cell division protease FtsH
MNCGDKTAAQVDEEVVSILKKAYNEAKDMIASHRQVLDRLAAFLIEKETITGKEFMEIFHMEQEAPEAEV